MGELEQAVRYVAEAKRIIAQQRERLAKLKAAGDSVLDAEQTLDVFTISLRLLEDHQRLLQRQTDKPR
jgi:hypothetical protein